MMVTSEPPGKQDLRSDLAKARKADHQHVGTRAGEILVHLLVGRLAHQPIGQQCGQRRQRHGNGDDRHQQRGRRLGEHAGGRRRAENDESELAALRQKPRDLDAVVVSRAKQPGMRHR
jgi:hypothetical protein